MTYSKLANSAAEAIVKKYGCSSEFAQEYVDNVVFNSKCPLREFFAGIFDLCCEVPDASTYSTEPVGIFWDLFD